MAVDTEEKDLQAKEERAPKELSQSDVDKTFDEMANSTLSDLNWNPNDQRSFGDRFRDVRKQIVKNRAKTALVGTGVIVAVAAALSTVLLQALQLVHIKEVTMAEMGGVQSHVFQTRSGRLYSRGFFFDDDGNFDGYKVRGSVFSYFVNRNSNNLAADIRAKGGDVTFDQQTGRVKSIRLPGPGGEVIDNSSAMISQYRQRQGVRNLLSDVYPERSQAWRSWQARRLYTRLGISWTLSNWLNNTKLVQWVEQKELAFKNRVGRAFTPIEKMRMKIRGIFAGRVMDEVEAGRVSGGGITPEDEEVADAERANSEALRDSMDEVQDDADRLRADLTDNPSPRRPGLLSSVIADATSGDPARVAAARTRFAAAGVRAAALGAVANATDKLCRVKFMLDAVEAGARHLRPKELATFSAMTLSMADLNKLGLAPSEDHGATMSMINSTDPDTGKSFFAGGGWRYLSGDKDAQVSQSNFDRYSSVGGSIATLSQVNGVLNFGLGNNLSDTACKVATNPFVQIAIGVTEAVVTFGPCLATGVLCPASGAAVAARMSGSIAVEAAFQISLAVIQPLAVRMVAGAMVSGDEYGEEYSDAFVSGASSLFGRRSAFSGFRPLRAVSLVQLDQEVLANKRADVAQQGVVERYLDPYNHRSLTASIIPKIPSSVASVKQGIENFSLASLNPFNFMGGFVSAASAQPVGALGASSTCEDPKITAKDLATDPFCNPIYGHEPAMLESIDPLDNLAYLIDEGYISGDLDNNGELQPGFEYDEKGNKVITDNGEVFRDYIQDCVEADNPFYDEDSDIREKCFDRGRATAYMPNDTPLEQYYASLSPDKAAVYAQSADRPTAIGLFDRIAMARTDMTVTQAIYENINRDFPTNELGGNEQPSTEPTVHGLESPPNVGPANAEGYFTMPDAAGGEYVFNGGTPATQRCGSKPLVDMIYTVAKRWAAEYPNNKLEVWDLNASGHASHTLGIDVDISTVGDLAGNTSGDPEASKRLGRMFADTGIVSTIFYNDTVVQADFNSYVKQKGLSGRMKSWPGHQNHFHVRILDQYKGIYSERCAT